MLLLATGHWPPSTKFRALAQFALKRRSEGEGGRQVGKISFIDLAGSERGADTYDNDRHATPSVCSCRLFGCLQACCMQLSAGSGLSAF